MSLSLNTDNGTVYQGTELVIRCTITVDSAVDTEYDINITWSSDPEHVMNGEYITISKISGSELSTVTIRPVNSTDSANYNCTARVNAIDTDCIISSMKNSDTMDIFIESK